MLIKLQSRQRGAALVVSLVILIALTLLGVTTMKGSSTELIMANNLMESALAFQAAEVGLNTAEGNLLAGNDPANMLTATDADPNYFSKATWTGPAATTITTSLANITNNPQFITKYLGEWNPDLAVSSLDPGFGGYGQASTARKVDYFPLTARGSGRNGVTFRTVQSYFGRLQ